MALSFVDAYSKVNSEISIKVDLLEKGIKVTITNILDEMGQGVGAGLRGPLIERLNEMGVSMLTGVKYEHFENDGVVLVTKEGTRKTIPADTIVFAAGLKPCQKLYETIKDKVPEIRCIGDCVKARTIRDAIAEGYQTAVTL